MGDAFSVPFILSWFLLVPPEKWESLIHRPRRFELAIDISRTVSRGRFIYQGRLIISISRNTYRARFPEVDLFMRPVDISSSINSYSARLPRKLNWSGIRLVDSIDFDKPVSRSVSWGRFVHEAGWHIELDKLVSSPVAQITKLIQISFISARSRQFLARDRFHLVPISEKLQISPSSWRDLGEILFISPRPQSHYKYRRVIGEISAKSHLSRRDLRDISNLAEFSSRFR